MYIAAEQENYQEEPNKNSFRLI